MRYLTTTAVLALVCASTMAQNSDQVQELMQVRGKLNTDIERSHKFEFKEFRKDVSKQNIQDIQQRLNMFLTGSEVAEASAKMQTFYSNLKVKSTVSVPIPGNPGFIAFDCVDQADQPARKKAPSPTAPKWKPDVAPVFASVPSPASPLVASNWLTKYSCPKGTVPIKRRPVTEVLLDKVFLKLEGAAKAAVDRNALRSALGRPELILPTTPTARVHRYAHAYALQDNWGASSVLNIWNPKVQDWDMSLSQIWVVAGDPDNATLQTVEAGWQVMDYWGYRAPTIFIYSTSDNYNATGCYVSKCGDDAQPRRETFVLSSEVVIAGRPIDPISKPGGDQAELEIMWYRKPENGNWWLRVNGIWVGYYPKSTFGTGPLTKKGTVVDFGGEMAGVFPNSEIGSGKLANAGRALAAYQSRVQYFDLNGARKTPALTPSQDLASCYTIAMTGQEPPSTAPGLYFYFGGPGVKEGSPAGAGCN